MNDEYEKYKKIFIDKVGSDYNKILKLNCDNMELKSRIRDLESAIEILNKNKNQVITIETKLGNNLSFIFKGSDTENKIFCIF